MPVLTTISSVGPLLRLLPAPSARSRSLRFRCRASSDSDQTAVRLQEYLVDAPESVGDGFSFSGGKYSDGPNRADEWLALGKTVKAHPVYGGKGKAKDPIFGLTLGAGSQSSADVFRWFCVEAGSSLNSPIILVHGFPSQAYSYRKVITMLSENYRAIAFDWLGFGFSDKPQPRYGFDYTLDEYVLAFESLVNVLVPGKVSLVVQGYFCPVVLKYASCHQEKLSELILVNPPLMEKHAKLPSSLALFSNFLLGEIFSQDPLRASDKALTSCGPYMMKEEDAMVYRRPYLTSGSSGFALNAISKAMKRDLKQDYVKAMRTTLSSETWEISTTICWGMRDRWLSYDGVEEFCKASNHKLVQLPMAGHHVQEDTGRELDHTMTCTKLNCET
ncbi:cis-3-alkyl-4-alkyloxetan-2-one decarboxylase-like isoform X1 [Zingiber officinale]|uniref:cis-3-alkyl-4-alkyloxetan-2-one decarboxylase-like isoform X1 n=1 Tax=Zingiber officinale TaxID=94328 RepID=UPI001C4ABC14|nr:cis-3-alkyl-4-alkyloxetan-2-one decarboxylase-like isoform X1 [Zingiber officinale]